MPAPGSDQVLYVPRRFSRRWLGPTTRYPYFRCPPKYPWGVSRLKYAEADRQSGPPIDEKTSCLSGLDGKISDLGKDLGDFADTAAAVGQLDLVITVDTSVAHLAGALGTPVWTLLPWVPDWRWLLDRDDSPWYPTMRLFRQPAAGDWDAVIGEVGAALRDQVEGGS